MTKEQRKDIDALYLDHLDSLRMSGIEFDEAEVRAQWIRARLDEKDENGLS